jgi:serine/threonine protein kinase
LHAQDIVYRDLKPENVLVDFEGHVKLADFGFAKQIPGTTKTFCGTPSYIAPEVILRQEYSTIVDWWTFGILVFEMLSGCSPFQDENSKKTYERIVQGRIRWPSNPLKYFSEEANDLISALLVFNPSKRLGSRADKDIQYHPWFSTLDWSGLEDRLIKPPIAIKNSRQRSESMGARSHQSMGSGNLGLRTGNKDLQAKYGSVDGMGGTLSSAAGGSSEIELELSAGGAGALQGEKSWSGHKNPNSGSAANLFVGF